MQCHSAKLCSVWVVLALWLNGLSLVSGQEAREASSIAVSGRIIDEEGRPIENAKVGAGWFDKLSVVAASDADGAFALRLPPGKTNGPRIKVLAYAPGHAITRKHLDVRPDENSTSLDNVQLTLPAAQSFTVKVENGSGQPIDRAVLQTAATDAHFSKLEFFLREELLALGVGKLASDGDGVLHIDWLPRADNYRITLDRDGFARETDYRVVAGDEPFTMRMSPGRLFQVRVRCQHDPTAVPDATLVVPLQSPEGHDQQKVSINADGVGSFRLRKGASSSIHVEHPSLIATPFYHVDWDDYSRKRDYQFTLSSPGIIHGRVINSLTKEGAEGVRIDVVDPEHRAVISAGISDANGEYSIKCPTINLEVGLNQFSVSWESSEQRVRVLPSTDSETEVPLLTVTPKKPIRGRVLGRDGKPAAGVLVGTASFEQLQVTDEEGHFALLRRPHRTNAVRAIRVAAREAAIATVVEASDEIELRLGPTCSASGLVLNQEDQSVADAIVSLRMSVRAGNRSMSFPCAKVRSKNDGSFVFHGLLADTHYHATVSSDHRTRGENFVTKGPVTEIEPLLFREDERIPEYASVAQQKASASIEAPPELSCQRWYDTNPLSLGDLHGKMVVLNFWGTWCGPCKRELPLLKMLHENDEADGVVVIGIHTATHYDPDAVQRDIEKYGLSYPIAIDDTDETTVAAYGVTSFPTTLMIGPDGKLRREMPRSQLLSEIQYELTTR